MNQDQREYAINKLQSCKEKINELWKKNQTLHNIAGIFGGLFLGYGVAGYYQPIVGDSNTMLVGATILTAELIDVIRILKNKDANPKDILYAEPWVYNTIAGVGGNFLGSGLSGYPPVWGVNASLLIGAGIITAMKMSSIKRNNKEKLLQQQITDMEELMALEEQTTVTDSIEQETAERPIQYTKK